MSTENAFKEVLDPNSLKAEDTTNVNKEKDYYEQVKSVVAETVENLENNKETLTSTIDNLLSWEKKTRLACDIESTQLLATTIIDCCFKKNDWETLNKMVCYEFIYINENKNIIKINIYIYMLTGEYDM